MSIDIGKSTRVALAANKLRKKQLAAELGVSPSRVTVMCKARHTSLARVEELASFFDMSASEFIAIGEDVE